MDNDNNKKQISKHKEFGKHALKEDIIFKGKKEDNPTEEDYTGIYFNESFNHDPKSMYYDETINNYDYTREKDLKEKVYKILLEKTELNFDNNRRKPSKIDFNSYYSLLRNELDNDKFSYTEIFNELAFYFSDKLLNMFKLLDNKWRQYIFNELHKHVGEIPENWNEIIPKNLTIGAEIEFEIDTEVEYTEIDKEILFSDSIKLEELYNNYRDSETYSSAAKWSKSIIDEDSGSMIPILYNYDEFVNLLKTDDQWFNEWSESIYEPMLITGEITENNHDMKEYKVNSFEDIYIVPIECITKILNNRKYKYNLKKLSNLDIL